MASPGPLEPVIPVRVRAPQFRPIRKWVRQYEREIEGEQLDEAV